MADVIKKGLLEVKKRGRFGGYKQKYVLLSNNLTLKCKTVEILDTDGSKSGVDVIRLTDIWTVQDKPSRSRYAFELIMGEDPIMTFSCSTVVEREEWTEAFRVLNQLALPSPDVPQNTSAPITDYFSITLMKNRSALEIGHSGQYLLSITSTAIVLHWRTGAIAHHWPTKNITKLYHPGREGHLLLIVKRASGSGPPMDFEFVTEKDSAVQILKLWNIRLLESIPCNTQQLNEISSSLTTAVTGGGKTKRNSRKTKSFRDKDSHKIETEDAVKRRGSFSRVSTYGTSATLGGMGLSQGSIVSQPLPRNYRDNHARSWTDVVPDQDTYFNPIRFGPGGTSPPPLPPRPVESSSDEDDPDYAYIDETEVKGPRGHHVVKRAATSELDDQLEELKKSIHRENKAKRREAEKRKVSTIQPRSRQTNSLRLSPQFVSAEPEDYLEPVPSKRVQSTSSDGKASKDQQNHVHLRSASEPYSKVMQNRHPPRFEEDNRSPNTQDLSPSSSESSPVFTGNPPTLPPRTFRKNSIVSLDSNNSGTSASSTGRRPMFAVGSEMNRVYGVNENIEPKFKDQEPKVKGQEPKPNLLESHKYINQPSANRSSSSVAAPPLPPRSPTKEHLSRKSSSSSLSSNSSNHRCPRCRSLRKSKSSVSKTVSLDQRIPHHLSKEESRKSLPNLDSTVSDVRHRGSHHHHSCGRCSHESSTDQLTNGSNTSLQSPSSKNLEYLQLVGEDDQIKENGENELRPELDLLTSCLQTLEYLTNKVNEEDEPAKTVSPTKAAPPTKTKSRNPYDHIKLKPDPNDAIKSVQTDLDTALRQTQIVQSELSSASFHRSHSENKHRPLTLGRNHTTGEFNLTSPPSSGNRTLGGHMNGLAPRSRSSMSHAPPVPPRSSVSLTQPESSDTGLSQPLMNGGIPSSRSSRSLSRHGSLQKFSHPPRSNSVLDHSPSYHGNVRTSRSQYSEPQGSSTVFFHHLKDRRLAHMV